MYTVTFTAHQQRNIVRIPEFFWAGDATATDFNKFKSLEDHV